MFYPFLFEQNLTQNYLWGGQRLRKLSYQAPIGEPIAEAWLISDRPEDDRVSVIRNGQHQGKSLRWLIERHAKEILGFNTKKFPVLIKILDAQQRLSLQVHPPKQVADRLKGESKNECWYFLPETNSGSKIFAGFSKKLTVQEFEHYAVNGTIEPFLGQLDATPGKLVYLPSGRLHAIDAGCFILEIQQNSNTTYRIHDWNRTDPKTGRRRDLHIKESLIATRLNDLNPQYETKRGKLILSSPDFSIEENFGNSQLQANLGEIIIAVDKPIELSWTNGKLNLNRLDPALIPSQTKYQISSSPTNKWLRIRLAV
ncbi:class I mannose-6-phosphate isomerase [Candidatus Berkelbacteria bacterium]|nr:class I mannose-6-phosphate isomerase [Candidatus Berkelbacteria bacterium]